MPKAVCSFLDEYDFSEKTIIPFCTSGGSGFGGSLQDIAKLCPGANITKGLSVLSMDVIQSRREVNKWLDELGLTSNVSCSSSVWKR